MKGLIALVLLFTFATTSSVQAQAKKGDKVPGYIIDNSGKKSKGTFIVGDWASHQVKIKFIKQGQSSKETYKPTDLKGYGFEETVKSCTGPTKKRWVTYETKTAEQAPNMFASTTVFMNKEVTDGHYSLYCYYIEVRNDVSNPYTYSFYIEDNSGNFEHVTEENFHTQTQKLFKDYKAMAGRIGKKDFQHKNMDRMVEDYNYWVENQHDSGEYRVAMRN